MKFGDPGFNRYGEIPLEAVISGANIGQVGLDGSVKFADISLNGSRDIQ